jgi:hypothetical protein
MMNSNCLLTALIVWSRVGGHVRWRKPNRHCPFGHFVVVYRGREIKLHVKSKKPIKDSKHLKQYEQQEVLNDQ